MTAPTPTRPDVSDNATIATEGDRITHYLCIGCPLGCRLEVEENEKHDIVEVRGFTCKRGDRYARQEHVEPRRMVTTTVAVVDGLWARLPVRTTDAIPKALVMDLCKTLRQVEVKAPVVMGQAILNNVFDTGVDVVASRSLPRQKNS